MSKRRFMIFSEKIAADNAIIDAELFKHVVRVLRLTINDSFVLVDEAGNEYQAVIRELQREASIAIATVKKIATGTLRSGTKITVCQALPKGEKIDLILQKGTELGVHDFWLFGGQRSVVRITEEQLDAKLRRWNKITAEAARQSGRSDIPKVFWYPTAVDAATATEHKLRLLLWEEEIQQSVKNLLTDQLKPATVIAAIGPEGGFDKSEAEVFIKHGYKSVSLGKRVLRTETAAIAISAILQYIWETD